MDNRTAAGLTLGMLGAIGATLAAQSPQTAPRVRGVSFAYAGYTAGGSLSLYLAQRIGPGMVLTGAVGNPETGYRAFILGGGTHVRLSASAGLTALVAGAGTTDGPSARLYLLPKVTAGRLVVSATAAAYQPLGGRSRRRASVDPLTAAVRLTSRVSAGVVATIEAVDGRSPSTGIGPAVHLQLPGGTLSIELVAERPASRVELRGSFSGALRTRRA